MIDGCAKKYEDKSLFLAVFLNLYLPGVGYLYLDNIAWRKKWRLWLPVVALYAAVIVLLTFPSKTFDNIPLWETVLTTIVIFLYTFLLLYSVIDLWNVATEGNPLKLKNPIICIILGVYIFGSSYIYVDHKNIKRHLVKIIATVAGFCLIFFSPQLAAIIWLPIHIYTNIDAYSLLKKKNIQLIMNAPNRG